MLNMNEIQGHGTRQVKPINKLKYSITEHKLVFIKRKRLTQKLWSPEKFVLHLSHVVCNSLWENLGLDYYS